MQAVKTNNNSMLDKLNNRFKGYYKQYLNLNEFIDLFNLDMILNNNIIETHFQDMEIYNHDKLLNIDIEELKEILKEEINSKDKENQYYLNELIDYYGYDPEFNINENIESIENYCQDYLWESWEVYQYFIIPYNDVDIWEKYTQYPIYYINDIDLYLIGITHFGMSWDSFTTKAYKTIEY